MCLHIMAEKKICLQILNESPKFQAGAALKNTNDDLSVVV